MIRIESSDDLWWALFDDSENTVNSHLRKYQAELIYTPDHDYIDFQDDHLYTLFVLKYSEYL